MILKLAIRNLFRNRRRTLLNILIISGGFLAVVIFQGFAANILDSTRWGAVNSQYGHIQIAAKKLWEKQSEDSFSDQQIKDPKPLQRKVAEISGVKSVSSRQTFYGLISNGDRSVAAQIVGFEPDIERGILEPEDVIAGEPFRTAGGGSSNIFRVAIGEGLAKIIDAKPGQNLTIIGQTADGGINAVDAEIVTTFRTVIQEIDDTTVFIPIELAGRLLDTDTAERLIVKLEAHEMVDRVLSEIKPLVGPEVRARSWLEVARLFNQTEEFFASQNAVVATIIFTLIFLSTVSTVSMSVAERTGEIGTLRAIGRSRSEIMTMFVAEGILLGLVGSFCGVILSYASASGISHSGMTIVIPGASMPIPIVIMFVLSAYVTALLATAVACVLATVVAVRKALKMKIVDALKYNI